VAARSVSGLSEPRPPFRRALSSALAIACLVLWSAGCVAPPPRSNAQVVVTSPRSLEAWPPFPKIQGEDWDGVFDAACHWISENGRIPPEQLNGAALFRRLNGDGFEFPLSNGLIRPEVLMFTGLDAAIYDVAEIRPALFAQRDEKPTYMDLIRQQGIWRLAVQSPSPSYVYRDGELRVCDTIRPSDSQAGRLLVSWQHDFGQFQSCLGLEKLPALPLTDLRVEELSAHSEKASRRIVLDWRAWRIWRNASVVAFLPTVTAIDYGGPTDFAGVATRSRQCASGEAQRIAELHFLQRVFGHPSAEE
jgi:hypothetical protein